MLSKYQRDTITALTAQTIVRHLGVSYPVALLVAEESTAAIVAEPTPVVAG